MSRTLFVHQAGPGVTVQDYGRTGYLAMGLSQGGAADTQALAEGAALLNQDRHCAAIEMAAFGGEFQASEDLRIALTGAPMRASIDGQRIAWNASHRLAQGARLSIGAVEQGCYGYLHIGGGVHSPKFLGARATQRNANIGTPVHAGAALPIGPDTDDQISRTLTPSARFNGGKVRIVPSLQTDFFSLAERQRFERCVFSRDTRGNRMGVRIVPEGAGFASQAGLSILSEVVVPGDIQITGDGTPFVLLCECQTTGGYPRIGSVLPADLARVAQASAGCTLQFQFVSLQEALNIERQARQLRQHLAQTVRPLVRDPRDIADLLAYQLISGATCGDEGC